jgi:hypothetical protein
MKERNIKTVLDEPQFQSLTIAKQPGFLFWYSIPAQGSLCLALTTAAAFLLLFSIRRFTPWRDWTFPASAGFDVHS